MWYLESKRGENEINGEEVGMEKWALTWCYQTIFTETKNWLKEANKFVVI